MYSKIKNLIPYILIIIFIFFIYNFYQENKSDFSFLGNLNFILILKILFLCFIYLITETIILKKITNFFDKKINLVEGYLVINATYLCNTFVQFSGLGFRAYFLKKIKKINLTDFIMLSLFIILIEIFVFSIFGYLSIFILEFGNNTTIVSNYIKIILLLLATFTTIIYFTYDKIYYYLIKIFQLNNNKYIYKITKFLIYAKNKNLRKYLLNFVFIFIMQFVVLFLIFYLGYSILGKDNSLLFSAIAATSTDLSFIFTLTPYAIGISEAFIFFGSIDLNVKMAEILFLTNLFRLSIFLIYFLFGSFYLFYFFKKTE